MDIKKRTTKHRTITDSHNGSNNKQKFKTEKKKFSVFQSMIESRGELLNYFNSFFAGLEVIKLVHSLKLKRNDWLLADTCPQAANHCALF